jgi:hypothetical protein
VCRSIKAGLTDGELSNLIERLRNVLKSKNEDECKIFKFRDMHQVIGSIYLLQGDYKKSIEAFEKTLELFNVEKNKEL